MGGHALAFLGLGGVGARTCVCGSVCSPVKGRSSLARVSLLGLEDDIPDKFKLDNWNLESSGDSFMAANQVAPTPALENAVGNGNRRDDRRRNDFLANVGKVTRILRDDYPKLLKQDPDLTMFTDNILLRDQFNFNGVCVQGKPAYKYFFWALRLRSRIFHRESRIRLTNVFYDQQDGLYVRWQLYGTKRLTGLSGDDVTVEDGLSLYKLNERGFVCEHIVVRVVPPKQRSLSLVLSWVSTVVAAPVPATVQCELEMNSSSPDDVGSSKDR
eukprot:CAMPEP_0184753380 /NCGR_PEP_ID=MMETSP0315-20130426/44069_1 /TAXON_ID=101924 /ORGANISM="Rhodosorus marinus, Strain UTEX LB 2760" /LENGTH=270 /DNA_ID=CAMNT_0027232753 /DNA_START=182 /DNA_END=994 /DNA_ORIENTATION=+